MILYVDVNLYIIHHGFRPGPFLPGKKCHVVTSSQQQAAHENTQAQMLGLGSVPGERSKHREKTHGETIQDGENPDMVNLVYKP